MSQNKFSKRIGISQFYTYALERGMYNPSKGLIEKISKAFNIPTDIIYLSSMEQNLNTGELGDCLKGFMIEGDSMNPILKHGDILLVEEIALEEIKDDHIYVVHDDNVYVKYIQKLYNTRGKISSLRMLSANYFEYSPFNIKVSDSTKVYTIKKIVKL